MHAAVVSSLSLEQYMELFHSLTKGTGTTVQHTTALEKNQYTTSALKEVLGLHGLTTGSKFNKQDTLDRMAGLRLFDPKHLMREPQQGQYIQSAALSEQCPDLGIDASDIASLGYSAPINAVQAALKRVFQLPVQPIHGNTSSSLPMLPASPKPATEPQLGPEQLNHPQLQDPGTSQADDTNALSAVGSQDAGQETRPGSGGPLPAASPARSLQQHCADQAPAAGTGESWWTREQANPQAPHPAPAGGSPAVTTVAEYGWAAGAQIPIPDDSPASFAWLDELVSRLQAKKLCPTRETTPAALTNHWIVFPLLETFRFTSMGKMLEIGPGLHPGRVVQFIGRNHNWDVCESDCTAAEHAWHFVRAEAVHKGSTRKFVDLKIDLHTSLRCAELEGLLRLIKDKLQDAWLLLEKQHEPESPKVVAEDSEGTDAKKRRVDCKIQDRLTLQHDIQIFNRIW